MLGPPKLRCLDRPVAVSIEHLVPADHFYRQLETHLDLTFVRDWVKDLYADRGRPSIDPVVFFKLQLIAFFERIGSERKLIEIASLNLAHRWYVGYHLDEPLPDHSSLTRIRQRLGLPIFRRFFEYIVELCLDADLVQGKDILFDATKVEANASLDSLVPRLKEVVDDHLVDLFGDDPAVDATSADGPEDDDSVAPDRWDLLEECRLDPTRPAARGYSRLSDERISRTDPDAALMRARIDHPRQLGYHAHYAVDGGRKRIILYVLVTPADVMENAPMLVQLRRVRFRWQLHFKRAIADTTYGTTENIVGLEDMGIQAYVPLPDWDKRTPYFGASLFTFDPERDRYVCPEGQVLRRDTAKYTESTIVYRADAQVCNTCPVKATCTKSRHGRTVHRSFDEEALERARARHGTPRFEWAMRRNNAPTTSQNPATSTQVSLAHATRRSISLYIVSRKMDTAQATRKRLITTNAAQTRTEAATSLPRWPLAITIATYRPTKTGGPTINLQSGSSSGSSGQTYQVRSAPQLAQHLAEASTASPQLPHLTAPKPQLVQQLAEASRTSPQRPHRVAFNSRALFR